MDCLFCVWLCCGPCQSSDPNPTPRPSSVRPRSPLVFREALDQLEEGERSALGEAIRIVLTEQNVTERRKELTLQLALVLYELDLLQGCSPDVVDRPDAKLAASRREVLLAASRAFADVLVAIPCSPTRTFSLSSFALTQNLPRRSAQLRLAAEKPDNLVSILPSPPE